jgi:PASTA domain
MLLPRVLVVSAVWITASGTLTFAADKTLTSTAAPKAPAAAPKPSLVVPDVRGQAYVFAKGILADGGFAWHVVGSVHGYSTNVVASQTPAAGTRVVDTGAPTIELRLSRGRYAESGSPEDAAPYVGTAARPVVDVNAPKKLAKHKKRTVVVPKKKPVAKAARKQVPKRRPAAFFVAGAPKEPLDEISLPARAERLDAWLTPSRRPSAANQRHWLYQHAWIVTGAKFGWWHGDAALRILIRVDQRIQRQWHLGSRSEALARQTLAAVEARAR